MNAPTTQPAAASPANWLFVLAFAAVYLSWGTTYLAIKKGVETLPPCLFGGSRVTLAGLILLSYLVLRGKSLGMPIREFLWTSLVGILMFVGGNGLITYGEKFVTSAAASVLVTTTPLWMVLLEMLWPWGDRLRLIGWLGLFVGLGGVLLLLAPKLEDTAALWQDAGPLLVLGSSLSWSLGSFVLRHRRIRGSHLAVTAYQMLVGGGCTVALGLLVGEGGEMTWGSLTIPAVYSYFHLLIFGSLVGFVAYTWLLGHVSAALAGTHAYVNPMVAILVGWLLNGEPITASIVGGMVVILSGVALVRSGGVQRKLSESVGIEIKPIRSDLSNSPKVQAQSVSLEQGVTE